MGSLLLWEGNGTQVKFLPPKKQMRRCAGGEKKKKTLWNITYILGKGKACFSSLASLKMLVTDGGVKNTGRITVWIHSRQLIDADLNGHGG